MTQLFSKRLHLVAWISILILSLGTVLGAEPVHAADGSPAYPVTQDLWEGGALEPVDPEGQPFPTNRDTTAFNEFRQRYSSVPWFMSVDIENGFLVTGLAHGFQVHDLREDPESPKFLGTGKWLDFLELAGGETKWPGTDVDMPTGRDTSLAYVGPDEIGLSIWDLSNKNQPTIAYQRPAQGFSEVYATRINGRDYAFGASSVDGLTVFDMKAALEAPRPCLDDASGNLCRSAVDQRRVFLGTLGSRVSYSFVDGKDRFVVGARPAGGFDIWDVSGLPAKPTAPKLEALGSEPVYGVALWKSRSDGDYYLALVTSFFEVGTGVVNEGRIYNVDCITRSSCGASGIQLVWSQRVGRSSSNSYITYSESNGVPFLYFGNDNRTEGGPQREFLMDVTDPANPVDVTPQRPPGLDLEPQVNYWSWYYERNVGEYVSKAGKSSDLGFKNVGPRRGLFFGDHFYRAAWSIFDVHRLGALTCTLVIDGPKSRESDGMIYPGSLVELTALASGCSKAPVWSLQNATFAGNTSDTHQTIVVRVDGDAVPGQEFLVATLSPADSENTGQAVSQSTPIEDPTPRASGISISPANPLVCQQVAFKPVAPKGRPALEANWKISDGSFEVTGTGDPFLWDSSQGVVTNLPGPVTYTVELTMSSSQAGAGEPLMPATEFTLQPLPVLGFTGSIEISPDPPETGVVDFQGNSQGGSVWRWDFGDLDTNDCPQSFTKVTLPDGTWCETRDPEVGNSPTHVYDEVGTYTVKVQVDDCFGATPPVEQMRSVTISSIAVLVADFRVGCQGNVCAGFINESLPVRDMSSGEPDFWDYDWNGDGTFEDVGNTSPVASHSYTSTGTFFPKLRVRRGGQEDVFENHPALTIDRNEPSPPPTQRRITVIGPSRGVVDEAQSFSASASGCTPSTTGWSWTVSGGGTISGSTNRNRIDVRWSSPGTYTVRASNSQCSGAAGGTRSVSIDPEGGGGPGGGELDATFDVVPASPVKGQAATLTARFQDADSYLWSFGDGSPSVETVEPTIEHVFGTQGQFQVKLLASKRIENQGCFLNVCTEEATRTVRVVLGNAPPPDRAKGPICPDDPDAFCLVDDRFKVSVTWTDQRTGDTGIGRPVIPSPLGDDQETTGFFYFFSPLNTELIVKAIDGRGINGNFWIFYGSLSDVEYTIRVEDQTDGMVREYHNEPGNTCGRVDLSAFTEDNLRRVLDASSLEALHNTGGGGGGDDPPEQEPGDGPCQPGPETLCLQDGRFQVEVDWQVISTSSGESGHGQVIPGTRETGYFWFFEPTTAELVVKILDGTDTNGHFWVFFGALTKEKYEIEITDLETGVSRVFGNDPATEEGPAICGGADIEAFDSVLDAGENPAP